MIKKISIACMYAMSSLYAGVDADGKVFYDEIVVVNDSENCIVHQGEEYVPGGIIKIKTDDTGKIDLYMMGKVNIRFGIPYPTYAQAKKPISSRHDSFTCYVSKFFELNKENIEMLLQTHKKFEVEYTAEVFQAKKASQHAELVKLIAEKQKADAPLDELIHLMREKNDLEAFTYDQFVRKTKKDIDTLVEQSGILKTK